MLLGLIGAGDGVAVKAVRRLGVDLDALRTQVEDSIGHGPQIPPASIRPSQPRGHKVLNSALPEALAHGTIDVLVETGTQRRQAGQDIRSRRHAREIRRLQREVSRLRELLLRHGIDPADSYRESA